jgi:hypothetical protein
MSLIILYITWVKSEKHLGNGGNVSLCILRDFVFRLSLLICAYRVAVILPQDTQLATNDLAESRTRRAEIVSAEAFVG